jgi:hypothetical protein
MRRLAGGGKAVVTRSSPSTEFTEQVPQRLGVVFEQWPLAFQNTAFERRQRTPRFSNGFSPQLRSFTRAHCRRLNVPGILWGVTKRPAIALPVTHGSMTKTIVFIIDPGSPNNHLGMTVGNLFLF